MLKDKKIKDGKIVFILANGIGEPFISENVDIKDVETILNQLIA